MKFIKPSLEYIDSYIEAQDYLEKEGLATFRLTCEEVKKDKIKFISEFKILETEKCIRIVSSFVPSTVYWLVDEKNKEVIGILNIRHRLNDYLISYGGHIGYAVSPNYRNQKYGGKLLDKGLEVAKELELGEILIICNSDNIGSKKIIESRKGILINSLSEKENIKLRYRIIINNSAQKCGENF
ncbi:MAG: GNAT family N-acetyltransferase [Fusobacteriaceae bacterium]